MYMVTPFYTINTLETMKWLKFLYLYRYNLNITGYYYVKTLQLYFLNIIMILDHSLLRDLSDTRWYNNNTSVPNIATSMHILIVLYNIFIKHYTNVDKWLLYKHGLTAGCLNNCKFTNMII